MTGVFHIVHIDMNLEILTKLLNSVARKYDCRIEYLAEENRLRFHGDQGCCRKVTEETLALFPADRNLVHLNSSCPIDEHHNLN